MSSVTVVIVHGIMTYCENYSHAFRKGVSELLPKELRHAITWQEVFWGNITHNRQRDYLRRVKTIKKLNYWELRHWVVQGLGDAAAYQKTQKPESSAYDEIQGRVTESLVQLDAEGHKNHKLVFVGHSLGCQILSSYIWDINLLKTLTSQEADNLGADDELLLQSLGRLKKASPFLRLDTLAGFITLGCNIPLFTFSMGPDKLIPITQPRKPGLPPPFPGAALSTAVAARAKWLNIYSPNDVLGYPMASLNEAHRNDPRIIDKPIHVEGVRRIPYLHLQKAHTCYWEHRKVHRETARMLQDLLKADMEPARRKKVRVHADAA